MITIFVHFTSLKERVVNLEICFFSRKKNRWECRAYRRLQITPVFDIRFERSQICVLWQGRNWKWTDQSFEVIRGWCETKISRGDGFGQIALFWKMEIGARPPANTDRLMRPQPPCINSFGDGAWHGNRWRLLDQYKCSILERFGDKIWQESSRNYENQHSKILLWWLSRLFSGWFWSISPTKKHSSMRTWAIHSRSSM